MSHHGQALGILDLFRLDDRVVLVTGAGSGLGRGFAGALAEVGADIALVGRREQALHQTASEVHALGRRALVIPADITDPEACGRIVDTVLHTLGRLDVLVNNAGVGTAVPALKETPDQFRAVIETNLLGAYWMAQQAGAAMRPGSAIVNISSVLGLIGSRFPQAAYASSKAALIGLTRDLSGQWAGRRGIRVNAIAPGYVDTPMSRTAAGSVVQDWVSECSPLGRLGTQREIDTAVVYLASAASSYVTGTVLSVDGGLSSR